MTAERCRICKRTDQIDAIDNYGNKYRGCAYCRILPMSAVPAPTDAERAARAEAILADIRGEIVTLTGHRDSRSRGGQHVGTGGRLSSAPPGVERVLREWLAKIDGAMPPAPPLPGPTAEDFAHHARVSQKGANAVRWQANVEPLIEAVRAEMVEGGDMIEAVDRLLAATAKEADHG